MSEFTEDLQKAINVEIEKSLPKRTGEMLQERLALVDTLEVEVNELKLKNESQEQTIIDLNKMMDKLEITNEKLVNKSIEVDKKEKELNEKDESIVKREQYLEIEMLKIELRMTQESNDKVMALTDKVFGVPTVTVDNIKMTRDVYDNGSYDANNNFIQSKKIGEVCDCETTTTSTIKV